MKRTLIYVMMILVLAMAGLAEVSAQEYRRENRRGNRAFAKGDFDKAVGHYEKALAKDTVNTLPLIYNMAYVLHSDRRDSTKNALKDSLALKHLDEIAEKVKGTEYEYDYHFTKGVIAIDMKDWQKAVDEFKQCLLMDPEDMEARENYIYAKEHLQKDGGGSGGGGGQDQQQDQQNQDGDQNQDQQNQEGDQNKDQQDQQNQDGDQNKDQQNQQEQNGDQQEQNNDQNQQDQGGQDEKGDQGEQQGQPQEPKISQQAAQQILQAMQAKERETQEKVEKKKAAAMRSKQKEKNW